MTSELNAEQEKIAQTIRKLLDKAAKTDQPAEAELFAAKARELLLKHNLDSATVESAGSIEGKREEAMVEGGVYVFQREVWEATAKLNFCTYWSQPYRAKEIRRKMNAEGVVISKSEVFVKRRRHALIGRVVNTRMTMAMADYLLAAIERELKDHLHLRGQDIEDGRSNLTTNYAWSFRKGAADRLIGKLNDRRREILSAEAEAERRAERAAKMKGVSMERGLTVAAFSKAEDEANYDFIHGAGAFARLQEEKRKAREERAARSKRMEDAYTIWAAANPGAARSKFEFYDKESGYTLHYGTDRGGYGGGRGSRGGSDGIDYSAFQAGSNAAKNIGLDPQARDRSSSQGRLR